jgi:hypothetical protein
MEVVHQDRDGPLSERGGIQRGEITTGRDQQLQLAVLIVALRPVIGMGHHNKHLVSDLSPEEWE